VHKIQTGFIYHCTLTILVGATLFFSYRELNLLLFEFFNDGSLVVIIIFSFFFTAAYPNRTD
jgi:hypothetical protein